MKLKLVCGTWVRSEDEKVLKVLFERETWPTVDELAEITGLPKRRIKQTIRMIRQQECLYEGRRKYLDIKSDDETGII